MGSASTGAVLAGPRFCPACSPNCGTTPMRQNSTPLSSICAHLFIYLFIYCRWNSHADMLLTHAKPPLWKCQISPIRTWFIHSAEETAALTWCWVPVPRLSCACVPVMRSSSRSRAALTFDWGCSYVSVRPRSNTRTRPCTHRLLSLKDPADHSRDPGAAQFMGLEIRYTLLSKVNALIIDYFF